MKRLAALFIVLTMTGSPVAHAACLAWCSSGTLAISEACHHSLAHTLPVAISGEANTCTAFLATSTFFTLERRGDRPSADCGAPAGAGSVGDHIGAGHHGREHTSQALIEQIPFACCDSEPPFERFRRRSHGTTSTVWFER
jgi:hypothetical protein